MTKIIPFHWLPASWGLKGKTRQIAQAEYELEGYELDKRLLEINKHNYDKQVYDRKQLELKKQYNMIDDTAYHRELLSFIEDETQKALALAELEYRAGELKEWEYQKKRATIKKEPWVTVLNMDFTNKTSLEGSFELDWNEYFVKKLEAEGYAAPKPDQIVNQWFMELCRNIALEEFDGVGNFTPDSEANLDAVKRWSQESSPEMKSNSDTKTRKEYK